ncbi:MAG: response regulator [Elusimicrobia bacterium]|nr:response regulator [Elusimicrobiota bacterium]
MNKILIVDDEENIRFILKEAFAGEYAVFTASEGLSAVEIIKEERPAMVFLDINMPGLDGVAVLKLIKGTGQSPVIWMLTGVEDLETVLQTLNMGASGYITKPFDVGKIREIVSSTMTASERKERRNPNDKPWQIKKSKK